VSLSVLALIVADEVVESRRWRLPSTHDTPVPIAARYASSLLLPVYGELIQVIERGEANSSRYLEVQRLQQRLRGRCIHFRYTFGRHGSLDDQKVEGGGGVISLAPVLGDMLRYHGYVSSTRLKHDHWSSIGSTFVAETNPDEASF